MDKKLKEKAKKRERERIMASDFDCNLMFANGLIMGDWNRQMTRGSQKY